MDVIDSVFDRVRSHDQIQHDSVLSEDLDAFVTQARSAQTEKAMKDLSDISSKIRFRLGIPANPIVADDVAVLFEVVANAVQEAGKGVIHESLGFIRQRAKIIRTSRTREEKEDN